MDPKPKQPATPAPSGPATRSTVYDEPKPPKGPLVDARPDKAKPTPASATLPAAAVPAPEQADGEEALTDPTTPVQPDTSGETDPSASSNAHPL